MNDEELVVDDDDEALHHITVDAQQAGGRIDAVIASAIETLSRAQVQRLIDGGHVTIGGELPAKPGAKVRLGDLIEVRVPAAVPLELVPENIPLSILFEDAELIVVDKPAGLVVHPAAGHASGTLVNALLFHCREFSSLARLAPSSAGIGGVLRPGIVHRLDKDTSGVIVATKTDRAHAALTAAFAAKSRGDAGGISREYLAIASPGPPTRTGTARTLYGRHPIHRKRFSSKVASGKSAVTHWEVVETLHDSALVRLRLETGRTHQIRVHASDQGWPLVGDPVYGHKPRDARLAEVATALGRQALHAATLAFDHPVTGERKSFAAPLPDDLERALAALR